MSRLLLILFTVTGFVSFSTAQNTRVNYIKHLLAVKEYRNAGYVTLKTLVHATAPGNTDTLNHLAGLAFYGKGAYDSASIFFDKVRGEVPLKEIASVYRGLCLAESGKLQSGKAVLQTPVYSTDSLRQLGLLELAGIALLSDNRPGFDSLEKVMRTDTLFANEKNSLITQSVLLRKHKKRSVLLGGVLSAVVPGLGKVYAGNKGQGLSAFLTCATFGAIAAENIARSGFKSPQSVIFSSLFGFFYLGNIYGSMLSVKLEKQHFEKVHYNEVRITMHMPLARLLGK